MDDPATVASTGVRVGQQARKLRLAAQSLETSAQALTETARLLRRDAGLLEECEVTLGELWKEVDW